MALSFCIIIPARLNSTRLPGKVLENICGKPMVQHVYERALKVRGVSTVIVATDSIKVLETVKAFGGTAVLTQPNLSSGTIRVAKVSETRTEDIIVNIQADEPLIEEEVVLGAVNLVAQAKFSIATAASPLRSSKALNNKSVVKVLIANDGSAVYFSRLPIPYSNVSLANNTLGVGVRSDALAGDVFTGTEFAVFQHIGIYVYNRETLLEFCKLPACEWENIESLEQLRALYWGIPIGVYKTNYISQAVDTEEDLERVRGLINVNA